MSKVAQSRCEQSIEDVVCRAGRFLTALDVYRLLHEGDRAASLSTVRRCLLKLASDARITRETLPRTGRCIYRSLKAESESAKDPLSAQAAVEVQQSGSA